MEYCKLYHYDEQYTIVDKIVTKDNIPTPITIDNSLP